MVVIPARNEGPRVGAVIQGVQAALPGVPVVVVENGSTDNTALVAREAGAHVLHSRTGYACALRRGFQHALEQGAPWIAQIDADGQHPPSALPQLVRSLEGADLVVGSRFVGTPGYHIPLHRRAAITALGSFATVCTGTRLLDVTSGLRVWRRETLASIVEEYPEDVADANVLVRIARQGWRVVEVSVPMRARLGGRSMHTGPQSISFVLKMAWLTAQEAARPRQTRPRSVPPRAPLLPTGEETGYAETRRR